MATGYYDTDDLIAAVQRKAAIPVSQSTFTNEDILAFATEELKDGIVPTVMTVHEEFYVYAQVVPIVQGQNSYAIPYRAIGGKLRDCMFLDNSGIIVPMSRISPDDRNYFQQNTFTYPNLFFYLQGNSIVITGQPALPVTGSIIFTYYMRPNDLVSTTQAATIQNISTNTETGLTTFTVDQIPTGLGTNMLLDLMQTNPGHQTIAFDIQATEVNPTNLTITFPTPALSYPFYNAMLPGINVVPQVQNGDYIIFAGQSIIPQCPSDLQPMLAQRTVARCLEALGDSQGLNNANTKLQEMESKSLVMIDQRVDGAPSKIVNRNGLLRNSKLSRRWYRG
jgi:hypothetical protein